MASKRRIRRKACGSKKPYPDQTTAVAHLIASGWAKDGVHTYKCPFCRQWHLGHRPESVKQAQRKRESK